MKEILKNSVFENIFNRSKFIAYSFSAYSADEVEKLLDGLREKYRDATHICYAFSLMAGQEKAVDDGEPQGTAGKPILDCIKKSGFSNTLVVVVRYFGGIKLGAGGLVRAYSNSASKVLAMSGEKETSECEKISFCLSLSENRFIKKLQQISKIKNLTVNYDDDIKMDFFCEKCDEKIVCEMIKNILGKEIIFDIDKKIYYI